MKLGVVFGPDGEVVGDIMSPTAEGFATSEANVPFGFRRVVEVFIDLDREQVAAVQALGNGKMSSEEFERANALIRLGIQMGVKAQAKRTIAFLERVK